MNAIAAYPNLFRESTEQAERSCQQPGCGKRLASWNKSGYCTEHHRPGQRLKPRYCTVCGKRLRSDAPPGELCLEHRLPSVELQFCKAIVNGEKCGNQLYANNTTGFCVIHHHLSRHPEAWKPCKEPGCPNRVLSSNKSGYCREHRYANHRPSVTGKPRFCTKCVEARDSAPLQPLAVDNKSGLCAKHIHLKYHPPVERKLCTEPDCTERLGYNNKSSLCAVHYAKHYRVENLAAGRKRTADLRVRLKAKTEQLEFLAWQPDDFDDQVGWKQVAGTYLRRHRNAPNAEVFAYLDKKRIKRKDGQSWSVAGKRQSVINDMNEVRNSFKVPGRILWKKAPAS